MEETYQILLGLRERYEAHHKLRYTDEALDSAAKYSSQYISDRFLPDKVRQITECLPPCSVCGSINWTLSGITWDVRSATLTRRAADLGCGAVQADICAVYPGLLYVHCPT